MGLLSSAGAISGTSNTVTTGAIDTTGASLIVLVCSAFGALAPADSQGNTWTGLTNQVCISSLINVRIYYCLSPTTSATHTFSNTGSATYPSINVQAWSGYGAFDTENGASNINGPDAFQGGSVTPGQNNSLVISAIGSGSNATNVPSINQSFTITTYSTFNGTGEPSGLAYLEQGTAAAVNPQWTWVGANNAAVMSAVFAPVSGDTVTVTGPVAYQTFQRNGSDQANIPVAGTYSGTPTSIEARFNGGSWSVVDASPSAGSFSGTLTTQAAGQGALEVRYSNDTGVTSSAANVGIGDVFVVAGQSNAEGYGTNPQSYTHATLKATKFTQSDVWADCTDPTDVDGGGSYWPLLATYIMDDQSVPVAFITTGVNASGLHNGSWLPGGANYDAMLDSITASGVNAVRAILWHQGEADALSSVTKAQYKADLIQLGSDVAGDVAGAPRLVVMQVGDNFAVSDADINAIRLAQQEAWDDSANLDEGPVLHDIDLSGGDGVHFKTDAELLEVSKRAWACVSTSQYGGTATAPVPVSAMFNGARNQVTVTFNQTLKTGLTFGAGAWRVSDNGTPLTVSGVAYHGTNTAAVVVTTSTAASGPVNATTYSLGYGDDAAGLVIPCGTDVALPTSGATNLRARVIVDNPISVDTSAVAQHRTQRLRPRIFAPGNAR
jgi:hypothetical protein